MENNPPAVPEPTTIVEDPVPPKEPRHSLQHSPGMYSDPNGHSRRHYPPVPPHIAEQYVKTIVGAEE